MPAIRIPDDHVEGFLLLARLEETSFEQFQDKFFSLMPDGAVPSIESIQKSIETWEDETDRKMVVAVLGLFGFWASYQTEQTALLQDIQNAYEQQSEEKENSEKLIERLKQLLENGEALRCTFKALTLIRESEHLYSNSRILTDIRPVFNEDDAQLSGDYAVILHRLKLSWDEAEAGKEAYLTMTTTQLEELKNVIERAIDKDKNLRSIHTYQFID